MRKTHISLILLLIGTLILFSCTDVEKDRADIYLTTTVTDSGYPAYVDISYSIASIIKVDFTSHPKNPTGDLSDNQDVTLYKYVVTWERVDGGTVTPEMYIHTIHHTVPAGGTLSLENIPLMEINQTSLPPFDQLFPWNDGVDSETGKDYIKCDANITFYGRTNGGQDLSVDHNLTYIFCYGCVTAEED